MSGRLPGKRCGGLSKVFPAGSAQKEVERRRLERLRSGEMEAPRNRERA